MNQPDPHVIQDLPYKIAVLCYLYDADGKLLMLHRAKMPNKGLYSPIGGKLEASLGEGPHECAVREISEEAGLTLHHNEVRLSGMVTERAYENQTHWLIFLYDVTRPIAHDEIAAMQIDEGTLEWVNPDDMNDLSIPETDRRIMWPLVRANKGGFFVVHIDCSVEPFQWIVHEGNDGLTD